MVSTGDLSYSIPDRTFLLYYVEAWLLLCIYCASSTTVLWIRTRTQTRTNMGVFLLCRLLDIAYVLYRFITYTSNPAIFLLSVTQPTQPTCFWIIAWITRGYLPLGVCFVICFASCLLEAYWQANRPSIHSSRGTPNNINTMINGSHNGKIVAGRWLRDNTQKKNITNPTNTEEEDYNSDDDSSYEESQDTYESSYDDSSLSDDEAVEAYDNQIHMQSEVNYAKCIVCSGNPKTVVVLPCHHLCFCVVCSAKLSNQFNLGYMYRYRCPVCKNGITGLESAVLWLLRDS